MLHHIGLFIHMAAIMLAAGGSIGSIMVENLLWKKVSSNSPNAKDLLPVFKSATTCIQIGLLIFLVSGLIMLYSVNWVLFHNYWFDAKLVFFVLLPLRGALVGKPTVMAIGKGLQGSNYNISELMRLKSKMTRFHIIQFSLVAIIIFLVIFKA